MSILSVTSPSAKTAVKDCSERTVIDAINGRKLDRLTRKAAITPLPVTPAPVPTPSENIGSPVLDEVNRRLSSLQSQLDRLDRLASGENSSPAPTTSSEVPGEGTLTRTDWGEILTRRLAEKLGAVLMTPGLAAAITDGARAAVEQFDQRNEAEKRESRRMELKAELAEIVAGCRIPVEMERLINPYQLRAAIERRGLEIHFINRNERLYRFAGKESGQSLTGIFPELGTITLDYQSVDQLSKLLHIPFKSVMVAGIYHEVGHVILSRLEKETGRKSPSNQRTEQLAWELGLEAMRGDGFKVLEQDYEKLARYCVESHIPTWEKLGLIA